MKTKVSYRHLRLRDGDVLKSSGRPPEGELWNWVLPSSRGGKTECHIRLYDDFDTLLGEVVGYAYCSLADTYVKETGRNLSFQRAMKALTVFNASLSG